MKNILIKLLLVLSLISLSGLSYIGNTYAEGVTVIVTEKIPGAGCVITDDLKLEKKDIQEGKTQMYQCTVKGGFKSVMEMMGNVIKYFTYIASLGSVLFIIINGILYSMGGAEPSMKDDAKKRIIGTLIGLVLLFLSGVVLNVIAPWIYK